MPAGKGVPGLPEKGQGYYEKCYKKMSKGETPKAEKLKAKGDQAIKSYCARVAWSIYCQNVNSGHKSCGVAALTPGSSDKKTAKLDEYLLKIAQQLDKS